MAELDSLQALFEDQIKDLFNAENQLVKALPKMGKAASDARLIEAFTDHLEETRGHVERLRKVAEACGFKPTGKKCAGMEGLIEEGKEVLQEGGEDSVVDAALVAAAQRIEHYEIAGYGNAVVMAQQLKLDRSTINLLKQTLNDEEKADKLLTDICQSEIFPAVHEMELAGAAS
jgi:ferritin-like metal-binding protein YciE